MNVFNKNDSIISWYAHLSLYILTNIDLTTSVITKVMVMTNIGHGYDKQNIKTNDALTSTSVPIITMTS